MNIILHHLQQEEQVSFARFNDGELGAILGWLKLTSRGQQFVDQELVDKLVAALTYESKNYYKGYPCVDCFPALYEYYTETVGNYPYQLPLSAFTNNHYQVVKSEMLKVLKRRRVCYIGGTDCDQSWIKRHFEFHALVHNKNTSQYYDSIAEYMDRSSADVFVFAVGAISRPLVMYAHMIGKSGLDLGSMFDPETRQVRLKPHRWNHPYKNEQKFCKTCNY